jgi:hypothetical protein
MFVLVTNRRINPGKEDAGDESLFGDELNEKGSNELRWARVKRNPSTGAWTLKLQKEEENQQELPSKLLLEKLLVKVRAGKLGPRWVVVVHGYGQSFRESLEEAHQLQQAYQRERRQESVNVILFSWPSKPGGALGTILQPISSYRQAQAAAVPSSVALAIALRRIWSFFAAPALGADSLMPGVRDFSLCLTVHSRGNLLLENLVRNKQLEQDSMVSNTGRRPQPLLLDTLTLHQADVDAEDHTEWVDRIRFARNIIITLNEFDGVLRLSDAINPLRLGLARSGFGSRATYVDFSGGRRVAAAHNLFLNVDNRIVQLFCYRTMTGFPVHQMMGAASGFWEDRASGVWRIGPRPRRDRRLFDDE